MRDLCQQEGVSCLTKLTKMQKLWDKASISDSGTGQRGVADPPPQQILEPNCLPKFFKPIIKLLEDIGKLIDKLGKQ